MTINGPELQWNYETSTEVAAREARAKARKEAELRSLKKVVKPRFTRWQRFVNWLNEDV